MKKNIILTTCIIIAIFIVFLAIRTSNNASKTNTQARNNSMDKISVGYLGTIIPRRTIMDLAHNKGFFAKNNVDVSDVIIAQGADALLQSNGADIVMMGFSGALALYLNDVDSRVISRFSYSTSIGLSRFPKGKEGLIKKVAIPRFGGEPQMTVTLGLKKFGIDPDKVTFIAIADEATRLEQLRKGEIDFTYANSFLGTYAQNKAFGNDFTIYQTDEVFSDPMLDGVLATKQATINTKSQAIQEYTSAIYEAIQYILNNPADTMAFIQTKYGENQEQATSEYAAIASNIKDSAFSPTWSNDEMQSAIENIATYYKPTNPTSNTSIFLNDTFAKNAIVSTKIQ